MSCDESITRQSALHGQGRARKAGQAKRELGPSRRPPYPFPASWRLGFRLRNEPEVSTTGMKERIFLISKTKESCWGVIVVERGRG